MVLSRNTPDTGWAWMVLISSFFIQMLSAMIMYGTGIMKLAILEEFKEDLVKVDWLGSLHVASAQVIGKCTFFTCFDHLTGAMLGHSF